jgi:hypothetical protein
MRKRKVVISGIAVMMLAVASSIIAVSQAGLLCIFKPEYVRYDFKEGGAPDTQETLIDNSAFPTIIVEGYPKTIGICNVTIDGVLYKYPNDFDYNYTYHFEFNALTGDGWGTISETLTFNRLPGKPAINGWETVTISGFVAPYINAHFAGDFRLTGTKLLSNVEGFGIGESATSIGGVRHFGLVKGWPY